MNIEYLINPSHLNPEDVFNLFQKAGISHPLKTKTRISRAIKGSALIATAWHNDHAISDFAWVGYISQMAVDPEYQRQGIGKNLVEKIKETLGKEVTLVVHSAEAAKDFYLSVGFEEYNNVFKISRTE